MFRKTANKAAGRPTAKSTVIWSALLLALFAVPAFCQLGHVHELYLQQFDLDRH